jgi:archaellum component FlaC
MLDSATLTALGISGAGLALTIGSGAIAYGAMKQKSESTADAVKELGQRIEKRLDQFDHKLGGISREVSEMRGELNARE